MTTTTTPETDTNVQSINYYDYVQAVHTEFVTRTQGHLDEKVHTDYAQMIKEKEAEAVAQGHAAEVSAMAVRSALAAFHLLFGAKAAEVATMPAIVRHEVPTPSMVFNHIVNYAVHAMHELSVELTDQDWRRNKGLRAEAIDDFGTFIMLLAATTQTEWCNAKELAANKAGDTPAQTRLIEVMDVNDVMDQDGPATRDKADALMTMPDNMVTLAVGLNKIPPERRAMAAAEIIRYANRARIEDSRDDFAGMVTIAVTIYG